VKVLITGASGFIGRNLIPFLVSKGHDVVGISRNPDKILKIDGARYSKLDDGDSSWISEIDDNTAIVNLAGESIFGLRWTNSKKKRILESRISVSNAVFNAVGESDAYVVQISAVGFYPNNTADALTEEFSGGTSFLAEVCKEWENKALKRGRRTSILRLGVVLGKDGGSLSLMSLPFRLFVGGKIGSGKQVVPWIHLQDVIRAISYAIDSQIEGIYNLVSPNLVTNKEFSKILGKVISRPSFFPTPSFLIRLALGEMSTMVLDGQNVSVKKLLNSGFEFTHPNLQDALVEIYNS